MNTMQTFQSELFGLYRGGQYRQALDFLTRELLRLTQAEQEMYLFMYATVASLAGETKTALQMLDRALEAGQWFPEFRLRHQELAALQGLPDFERVVAVCLERHAAAEQEARRNPIRVCHVPEPLRPPSPLLLAFHGSTLSASAQAPYWDPAVAHGWLTVLPQSSQMFGPGTYMWKDYERAAADVEQHFREICEQYSIDTTQVLLGGFSAGATLALRLALDGHCSPRGVIMVCPGTVDEGKLRAALDRRPSPSLETWLILGRKDPFYGQGQKIASLLQEYGVPCMVDEFDDLEHQFPPNFSAVLANLLRHLT